MRTSGVVDSNCRERHRKSKDKCCKVIDETFIVKGVQGEQFMAVDFRVPIGWWCDESSRYGRLRIAYFVTALVFRQTSHDAKKLDI
jgi:hypothetical protein